MSGIDPKALNAACREFRNHLYIAGKTSKDERVAINAAIRAYELHQACACEADRPSPAAEDDK